MSWDEQHEAAIVVRDLTNGSEDIYEIGGDPYSCALSGDGAFLVWDDTQYAQQGTRAKYALELATDAIVRYAEFPGWGTDTSGAYVSWAPWENQPGFFDMKRGVTRYVALGGASSVYATMMGGWYTWQQVRETGEGTEGSEATYYFLRLD